MNMLKSALWYARHGWYVIPLHSPIFTDGILTGCTCEEYRRSDKYRQWLESKGRGFAFDPAYTCHTPGKHPHMSAWEDAATVDLEQINKWWHWWPTANIGIAAGKSGLIVLDYDQYKEGAMLPKSVTETVTSLSGGGGEHLIYLHPTDTPPLGNSKSGLPAHIDIRGWGGQFVAPPSLHPSGRRYHWETGYGPHEMTPASLPDEIKTPLVAAATMAENVNVELGEQEMVNVSALEIPNIVKAILLNDRSRIDESIITSLVKAGLNDAQILYVFNHHAPTSKFAEKNGNGIKYLQSSISKARSFLASRIHQVDMTPMEL